MKQLAIALIQYNQDYDDRFPIAKYWAAEIYPYVKSTGVYHCPEDKSVATETAFPVSYAINRNVDREADTKFTDLSVTVLACNYTSVSGNVTHPNDIASSSRTCGLDIGASVWGDAPLGYKATARTIHDPFVMFLASDRHAKLLRPDQVSGGANVATSTSPMGAKPDAAAGTKALGIKTLTFSLR